MASTHKPLAKIYKPYKTATQSGKAKTDGWILAFESTDASIHRSILGWLGTKDTRAQMKLSFPTQQSAEAFAQKHKIDYEVIQPRAQKPMPKSYAANFENRLSYL